MNLSSFAHQFLRPIRLAYTVLCILLMAGLAEMSIMVRGFPRSENIEVYLKAYHKEFFLAQPLYTLIAALWLVTYDAAKRLHTRSQFYTTPVSTWQWGRWNGGFLLVVLVITLTLAAYRSPLTALPLLFAAALTLIEALLRCAPRDAFWNRAVGSLALGLFFAQAYFIEEFATLAESHPWPAAVTSFVFALSTPFLLARPAQRAWRRRFVLEGNAIVNLGSLWFGKARESDRSLREEDAVFPPAGLSNQKAARHMLAAYFPQKAHLSHAKMAAMVILQRTLITAVTLTVTLTGLYWLETQDDGHEAAQQLLYDRVAQPDIWMFPMLVFVFLSPHLFESKTSPILHYAILGRQAYAECLRSICLRLTWLIALPVLLGFTLYEYLVGLYLGEALTLWAMGAIGGQFLATLTVVPLGMAWALDKTHLHPGTQPVPMMAKFIGLAITLTAFPVIYDKWFLDRVRHLPESSLAPHLGMIACGLGALLIVSRLALRAYLDGFFEKRPLVQRSTV